MLIVRKPEENRLLGGSRRRWVDNIEMNLREIGWDYMYSLYLTQKEGSSENGNEPQVP
jgi:hypothetical protein